MNTPKPSPRLTPDQMHAVLTDWHAYYSDDPLYVHISHSFEDMADIVSRADRCVIENACETSQEDMPGFAGTYARLGALNVSRVAV